MSESVSYQSDCQPISQSKQGGENEALSGLLCESISQSPSFFVGQATKFPVKEALNAFASYSVVCQLGIS